MEGIFTAKIANIEILLFLYFLYIKGANIKILFFLYFLYIKGANIKMSLISIEGYKNAGVHCLIIKKTDEVWVNMKHVGDGLGVTNISDLVLKEIKGIYEEKKLTKEEIKNYKMTVREIYEKFTNLSEDKLNEMSSKNVYFKNTIMKNNIKHCRGEKKKV